MHAAFPDAATEHYYSEIGNYCMNIVAKTTGMLYTADIKYCEVGHFLRHCVFSRA